ncbi:MAG: PEP-CTERM sorting domain-containing protein [Armatimonadaceae bacterium]
MDVASGGVPEPGEWAAMGILASGLTGLMVRARRRK